MLLKNRFRIVHKIYTDSCTSSFPNWCRQMGFSCNGNAKIVFKPRTNNTQLVRGAAIIDSETGRVIETEISGEHDMVKFRLRLDMGKEGLLSLVPSSCRLESKFSFLGNKLSANYSIFIQDSTLSHDSIKTMPIEMAIASTAPAAPSR